MKFSSSCVLPAVCLLLVAGSGRVSASGGDAAATVSCAISAWVTDGHPGGLAVHAGPGIDAPVIARLPPPVRVGDYAFAPEVSITGSKDGWFRIDRAAMDNYVDGRRPEVVFEGEGWVSGRLLGLSLNDTVLHHGSSRSTPTVASLSKRDPSGIHHGPDSFVVERLVACQGDWVEVEGTFLGTRLRGWATATCSNQVTTCP